MKKIHFIGIGGIGVSALARCYLEKGHKVSGSDLASSEITKALEKARVKVFIPQKKENISKDMDLVVYSPAVQKDNPEFKQAKKFKIKLQTYPQALGELAKNYRTIAIAGTHGKSTTTSMLGLLLVKAGLDPTVIVGTKLKEFGDSNFRAGKSEFLVIEACEYEESFLNYYPEIIILTNIEEDHLDYYKNLKNILEAFKEFISHLPKNGVLIVNKDDKNIQKILESKNKNPDFKFLKKNIKFFSLKDKEAEKLKKILKVPGKHNVLNALSALVVARVLGIPDKTSYNALSKYKGCWRRFDKRNLKGTKRKMKIILDYAHHPTEIKAALQGAREKWLKKKIWAVFQPHQYERTYRLFNDFAKAFNLADRVVLTDIFSVAGRESKEMIKKTSGAKLAQAIKKEGIQTDFIKDFRKIPAFLKEKAGDKDIILIIGAGNIYKLADK